MQASPDRVRHLPQQGICMQSLAWLSQVEMFLVVVRQGHALLLPCLHCTWPQPSTCIQVHGAAIDPTLMTQSLPAVMMTCRSAWWARASTSLPLWATHWYTKCGWEAGRLRMSHTHRRPSNPAGLRAVVMCPTSGCMTSKGPIDRRPETNASRQQCQHT